MGGVLHLGSGSGSLLLGNGNGRGTGIGWHSGAMIDCSRVKCMNDLRVVETKGKWMGRLKSKRRVMETAMAMALIELIDPIRFISLHLPRDSGS